MRGKMQRPSKAELEHQLSEALARIAQLRADNERLRSGIAGVASDAPVAMIAGITETGTTFVEPIRPLQVPIGVLDVVAAHLTRMAAATLRSDRGGIDQRMAHTEGRMEATERTAREALAQAEKTGKQVDVLMALMRGQEVNPDEVDSED